MTYHCWLTPRPVPAIWARVGRWIPYTASQVAARRAARAAMVLVCVTVPAVGGGLALLPDRPATRDLPSVARMPPAPVIRLPRAPIWRDTGLPVHPVDVPEPASVLVLVAPLVGLWRVKR